MRGVEERHNPTRRDYFVAPGSLPTRERTVLVASLVAVAVLSTAYAPLSRPGGLVPLLWVASGLFTGAYLTCPRPLRRPLLGVIGVFVLASQLAIEAPLSWAVPCALAAAAEPWIAGRILTRENLRPGLEVEGDVSRMIGAAAMAPLLSAALTAAPVAVDAGAGRALLVAGALWATHAASLLVVLPLFLPTSGSAGLAGTSERVVMWALVIGCTSAAFWATGLPLLFAIMPMFGWLAYRSSVREGTVLIAVGAAIGGLATALGHGPIWAARMRFDLPPEVVTGLLSLFLLDCALIMLPVAVAVTQQRSAATRADAERARLAQVLATATGTAILVVDADGLVTQANPGVEALLGRPTDQLLGAPWSSLGFQEIGQDGWRPATLQAGPDAQLWLVDRHEGQHRAVSAQVSVLRGEDSEPGLLVTAHDVTEQEEARERLEQALSHEQAAVRRLESLDQVKSDFVASVSHELRTPITSLLGYAELLEDELDERSEESLARLAGRMSRNGHRLLLLIEDLLLLSDIESRATTMSFAPVELGALVQRVVDAAETGARNRSLGLALERPSAPLVMHGDEAQLERVTANLLSNAVKFTPPGGRVEVALAGEDEQVRLCIRDTGLGIPEAEQDGLFQRFFRSTVATREAIQGAGLGLTIAHRLVLAHGGTIEVVSAEGEGTEVTVRLPLPPPPAVTTLRRALQSPAEGALEGHAGHAAAPAPGLPAG